MTTWNQRLAWGVGACLWLYAVGAEELRAQADVYRLHPASSELERLLQTSVMLEFRDEPLNDVLATLEQLGVNCQLDRRALEDAGLDASTITITRKLTNVTMIEALDLILRESELTWGARGNFILISTEDATNNDLETWVFPVRDLVTLQYGGEIIADFDPLIEVITTTTEPATWDVVGGYGSITPHPGNPSALVVSQTPQVLRKVRRLLSLLRQAGFDERRGTSIAARSGASRGTASRRYVAPER